MTFNETGFPNFQESSGSLPDFNTAEAILYGSSYSMIKSMLWRWDEMEDYLIRKADSLDSQIIDREWAYGVMRYNRYLIFARSPPVNEVNHLRDLMTLRQLCKCIAGIRKIDEYRKQNQAWARMKGISEYVSSRSGRSISQSEWREATAQYNMVPITYDSVHGMTEDMLPEENVNWSEFMKAVMGEKEYGELVSRMSDRRPLDNPAYEGFVREIGEDIPPAEDDKDIQKEEDDSGFWHMLQYGLDIMFDSPSTEAKQSLQEMSDECSRAADFWEDMDIDDNGIIERLIGFAREAYDGEVRTEV